MSYHAEFGWFRSNRIGVSKTSPLSKMYVCSLWSRAHLGKVGEIFLPEIIILPEGETWLRGCGGRTEARWKRACCRRCRRAPSTRTAPRTRRKWTSGSWVPGGSVSARRSPAATARVLSCCTNRNRPRKPPCPHSARTPPESTIRAWSLVYCEEEKKQIRCSDRVRRVCYRRGFSMILIP